ASDRRRLDLLAIEVLPAPVGLDEARALVVREVVAAAPVAGDEFDDAGVVVGAAGLGGADLEAEPLGLARPALGGLAVALVAGRVVRLDDEVDGPAHVGRVVRAHERLGRRRRRAGQVRTAAVLEALSRAAGAGVGHGWHAFGLLTGHVTDGLA